MVVEFFFIVAIPCAINSVERFSINLFSARDWNLALHVAFYMFEIF